MNGSSYPKDLIGPIRAVCRKRKGYDFHRPPPLPVSKIIENFLDVAFHASFQTEEGRRPGFRIILYSPSDHAKLMSTRPPFKFFENSFRLMPLDSPRSYSAAEINRLAPAAEMKRLLICVTTPDKTGAENELRIWALLDTGENWWKFVHHEASGGVPPPNFLTVTSTAPGEISVSTHGDVLCNPQEWPDSSPNR